MQNSYRNDRSQGFQNIYLSPLCANVKLILNNALLTPWLTLLRLGICGRHLKFEIAPVKEGSPHDRQLTKAHSYPIFSCGFKNLVHVWFYHTIARAAITSHTDCWERKYSQYRSKRCPLQKILEACTWRQSILQPLKCSRYRYIWYKLYPIGHNVLYKASTGSLGLR